MGTVTPTKLLNLWIQENISIEMAIGHILQNLVLQQNNLPHPTHNLPLTTSNQQPTTDHGQLTN